MQQEDLWRATTKVDCHNLNVVQQRKVGVLQRVLSKAVQTAVEAVVQNVIPTQDIIQDRKVILVQHVIQAHNLHVCPVQCGCGGAQINTLRIDQRVDDTNERLSAATAVGLR